jgi:hypothetical protein
MDGARQDGSRGGSIAFRQVDWMGFYLEAKEEIPLDAPEPTGRSVVTSCFVDYDHAGCRLTRQSHTGILIFVNNAPILWNSKRQNMVESLAVGSEFVAMWTAVIMIEGLQYKIGMMGIPLDGKTSVFYDNDGVMKNTTAEEEACGNLIAQVLQSSCSWLHSAG